MTLPYTSAPTQQLDPMSDPLVPVLLAKSATDRKLALKYLYSKFLQLTHQPCSCNSFIICDKGKKREGTRLECRQMQDTDTWAEMLQSVGPS